MRTRAQVSAAIAPIALIGGWSIAQIRQPTGFDPITDTISALAATAATDSWIMTLALFVLGVCHIVTALGLTEAKLAGRVILGIGGGSIVIVAAQPQPATFHVPAATVGFIALSVWPAFSDLPSRRTSNLVTGMMLALLGWLAVEISRGDLLGLSERVLAAAQSLWPLAVVVLTRSRQQLPRESVRD